MLSWTWRVLMMGRFEDLVSKDIGAGGEGDHWTETL